MNYSMSRYTVVCDITNQITITEQNFVVKYVLTFVNFAIYIYK